MHEKADEFKVILEEIEGGATFDPDDNGGPDTTVAIVQISGGDRAHEWALHGCLDEVCNHDKLRLSWEDWKSQFRTLRWVNGSKEDHDNAGVLDYAYHFVSLPFQVVFAIVPPPSYFGGWLTFVVAISFIGVVTAIIGDLASILGCLINWDDQLTAITIVALGTSLPDTFASMTSAVDDEYADNSIGNVTGSNSVNVFLGLGLPWALAASYWNFKWYGDELPSKWIALNSNLDSSYPESSPRFIVVAGDLSFSVMIFLFTCIVALSVIFLRRRLIGAELGGPKGPKIATAVLFVGCWLFYVLLSFWKLKNRDADAGQQGVALAIGVGALFGFGGIVCTLIIKLVKDVEGAQKLMETRESADSAPGADPGMPSRSTKKPRISTE